MLSPHFIVETGAGVAGGLNSSTTTIAQMAIRDIEWTREHDESSYEGNNSQAKHVG